MLVALNREEKLVVADTTLSKDDTYHCPACRGAVHLKKGTIMRPHFAHYKQATCAAFSEGETAEHIQGKLQLAAWFDRLNVPNEMEAYLPELKQRPDLLVTTSNRKIAVEFQCNPIAIEQVVARTAGYLKAGYEVVWLLGKNFEYKRQLTAFQKACLTQIQQQLVLFHYSVAQKRVSYRYNFQRNQNQKMTQTQQILRYGEPMALRLKSRKIPNSRINYELEHQKLLRQCQYPSEKTKAFLQLLYNNQETIISLPKELYAIVPSEWILQQHPLAWKLQLLLKLEEYPLRTVITKRMLDTWRQDLFFHVIPQLTDAQQRQPLYEFLEILITTHVLTRIRPDKWSLNQYPKRFQTLERKFS